MASHHQPPARRTRELERWHAVYDKALTDGLDEDEARRLADSPEWVEPGHFATGRQFWPERQWAPLVKQAQETASLRDAIVAEVNHPTRPRGGN